MRQQTHSSNRHPYGRAPERATARATEGLAPSGHVALRFLLQSASWIAVALLLLIPVLAANDPGHDTLYVEEQGDSEVNGSINITENLQVTGNNTVAGLELYGDGTDPSTGNYIAAGTGPDVMRIDTPGDLYLKDGGGDILYIGATGLATFVQLFGSLNGSAYLNATVDICIVGGNCLSSVGSGSGNMDLWRLGSDSGSIASITNNTLVNITGGSGITTSNVGGVITISATGGSGNFDYWTAGGDSGTVQVNNGTQLNFTGSGTVSTAVVGGEVVITGSAHTVDTDDQTLQEVTDLGSTTTNVITAANLNTTGASTYVTELGVSAGSGNTGIRTTAIGWSAGQSNQGNDTHFLGYQAGYQQTANDVIGIGYRAAYQQDGAVVIAIGDEAGHGQSGNYSILIGQKAGYTQHTGNFVIGIGNSIATANKGNYLVAIGEGAAGSNTGNNTIFIGQNAGDNNQANGVIGIGTSAGNTANHGASSIFIGTQSGSAGALSNSVSLGYQTGYLVTGTDNVLIGYSAGTASEGVTNNYNTFVGSWAGRRANSSNSVMVGYYAGYQVGMAVEQSNNTYLGYQTGYENDGNNNLFLGYQAGYDDNVNNQLIIDQSVADPDSTPILVGDFAAETLVADADFNVTAGKDICIAGGNCLSAAGTGSGDITAVYTTAGLGYLYNGSTSADVYLAFNESKLNDTIDARSGGTPTLQTVTDSGSTTTNTITAANLNTTGSSTFVTELGVEAGETNTGTYVTLIGYQAGYLNTQDYLTAIGNAAGYNNSGAAPTVLGTSAGLQNTGDYLTAFGSTSAYQNTGHNVTALGYRAGRQNSGNNSIFIGHTAGFGNTANNQLIIGHNVSDADGVPLIRGDFANENITFDADINVTSGFDICITGGNCLSSVGSGVGGGWTNTSTQVSLVDSTDNVSAGQLFIDNTNNYIGIGNNSPTRPVYIYLNDARVSSILRLDQNGAGDSFIDFRLIGEQGWAVGIDSSDSDKFKISDNSQDGDIGTTPRLTINTAGNVGINTTNPNATLHVNGDVQIDGNTTTPGFINSTITDGTTRYFGNGCLEKINSTGIHFIC